MAELPTHTKCPHCGHEMRMALWCYAHWNIRIEATCEKCGEKYSVLAGVVLTKPNPKKHTLELTAGHLVSRFPDVYEDPWRCTVCKKTFKRRTEAATCRRPK